MARMIMHPLSLLLLLPTVCSSALNQLNLTLLYGRLPATWFHQGFLIILVLLLVVLISSGLIVLRPSKVADLVSLHGLCSQIMLMTFLPRVDHYLGSPLIASMVYDVFNSVLSVHAFLQLNACQESSIRSKVKRPLPLAWLWIS